MDVDMAVINLGNVGQLLLFMIDGEIIYEVLDTSTVQMMEKGYFRLDGETTKYPTMLKPIYSVFDKPTSSSSKPKPNTRNNATALNTSRKPERATKRSAGRVT